MQNKKIDSTDISYRNPFDDYNANVLTPEALMEYWYTPFSTDALKEFNEKKFFTQKMPIILQGSRGSGKTTILKYFSFPVQCERAVINKISIYEQLINDEGVGFYFRCDDSFLKEFENVFRIAVKTSWTICFEHYFELFFVKNLLEMINELDSELEISLKDEILNILQSKDNEDIFINTNIEKLTNYIYSEIAYINKFKNEALFINVDFQPKHIWSMYDISGKLINAISLALPDLSNLSYLLLVDEFENLPIELQKMFNTMMKFCDTHISMRVGRRSENIVTTETINKVEYLREQHDYSLIVLDQWQEVKNLKPYLSGIAKKRLEAFEGLQLSSDITKLLGDKEDLDAECNSVADERNLHMRYLLNANDKIKNNPKLLEEIISVIAYPQNRIAEMLNALWVARSDEEDLIAVAYQTVEAMNDFLCKKNDGKYKNDYNNKYRYALTILMCVAYKKDKSYYSFNTICYLSEGNARTFINLCRAIISDAFFYEKNNFITTNKISIKSQSRAIKSYSESEFHSVCSIIQSGNEIKMFILSLGNIFSDYHKDRLVRYPETNQFTYNPDNLLSGSRKILDIAISWSLIKRRKDTQRLSAGIAKEGNLYTLNKIFAPLFNISYRTRGGVNVILSSEEIQDMILGINRIKKLNFPCLKKKNHDKINGVKKNSQINQLVLFDLEERE